jgi:hypothetical protein
MMDEMKHIWRERIPWDWTSSDDGKLLEHTAFDIVFFGMNNDGDIFELKEDSNTGSMIWLKTDSNIMDRYY